jgi:hypothetical protein
MVISDPIPSLTFYSQELRDLVEKNLLNKVILLFIFNLYKRIQMKDIQLPHY